MEDDSNKVNLLNQISWNLIKSDPYESLSYAEKAINIATQINDLSGIGKANNFKGIALDELGNYESALACYSKSYDIASQLNNKKRMAATLKNMGIIHERRGDFNKALELHFQSLKIREQINDSLGIASTLNGLAIVYRKLGNFDKSMEMFLQAKDIYERLNDPKVATAYGNIAGVYYFQDDYIKALEYIRKSMVLYQKQNNKTGIANSLANIAELQNQLGNIDSSFYYAHKSIEIRKSLGNKRGLALSQIQLGVNYIKQNNPDLAIKHINEGIEAAKELQIKSYLQDGYKDISTAYELKKDYKSALEAYKNYSLIKDSLFSESKSKDIGKLEAKYEFEKAQEDARRKAEETRKIKEQQEERRNNLQYSGIFIVILSLFLSVFLSGKLNISERVAEGLIFFTFLLFFEFCLVLLDPIIENWSGGQPAVKLCFNAILAVLIFPLHTFIENLLKKKLQFKKA